MKRLPVLLLTCFFLCFTSICSAGESLLFNVNPNTNQQIGYLDSEYNYQPLAAYLGNAIRGNIKLVISQKPGETLQRIQTGQYGILLAPAHTIGNALKYGYEPIVKFPGTAQTVFVTLKNSTITKLSEAKGKILGLTDKNSLATYLALGELNAAGIPLDTFFSETRNFRFSDSALFALKMGQADIVAVDKSAAYKWLEQNPGKIILQSKATPDLSIAINNKVSKAEQDKIREALLQLKASDHALIRLKIAAFEPASRADFAYVSALGYTASKTTAQGETDLNAAQPTDLLAKQNCFVCHAVDRKLVGPAYKDVAKHYGGNKASPETIAKLADKVIRGGSGNWNAITGGAAMAPHPELSHANAEKLVRWVLSR
jgi:cytochrome c551/c552